MRFDSLNFGRGWKEIINDGSNDQDAYYSTARGSIGLEQSFPLNTLKNQIAYSEQQRPFVGFWPNPSQINQHPEGSGEQRAYFGAYILIGIAIMTAFAIWVRFFAHLDNTTELARLLFAVAAFSAFAPVAGMRALG